MAFPLNPTDGQTYTQGGVDYKYVAAKNSWVVAGAGGSGVPKVTTAQRIALDTTKVAMCLDTDMDILFRTNSNNDWVEVVSSPGGGGGGVSKMTKAERLAATPTEAQMVYDTTDQAVFVGNGSAWIAL